ncbi:hypothetical protein ACFUNF_31995 [Streptomyces sp. NPDC057291]|uniref:hypothetical protein n=1 Tax=Streptomyces sp. NPDC057291 TaxID=3346087 RepID=UPI00362D103A
MLVGLTGASTALLAGCVAIPAASLGPAFPALLAYQIFFGLSATVRAISMTTTQ